MTTNASPVGLGWWVAFEHAIDPGPKATDIDRAIAVCRDTGATWIAVRSGAGASLDADLDETSVRAFATAGLGVAVWHFDYSGSEGPELAILARWRRVGVRWAILNAEFQYLANASADQARAFVRSVRALGFEWVAHAPPDYAGGRGDGCLGALDAECDAVLPQVYAFEHDDRGHVHHLNEVRALYAKRGLGADKVWPILCSYRPPFRGYDAGKPRPLARWPDQGGRVAIDVCAGLDHAWTTSARAPSIYTIEAAHPEVIAMLCARWAAKAPTDPAPATLRSDELLGVPLAPATPIRAGDGANDHHPTEYDDVT